MAGELDIFVARDTNVGLMAGLLQKVITEKGVAMVGGMGAQATNNVMKALLITCEYMRDALDEHAETIVGVPQNETFMSRDEERVRVVFACFKTSNFREE